MARKPANFKLEQDGDKILNGIREQASAEYKGAVPKAVRAGEPRENGNGVYTKQEALERLRTIGETIWDYKPFKNEFIAAVDKIAETIISSKSYSNPLSFVKKGILEYGESIEELFVNLTDPEQYDPERAESTVFRRKFPDTRAAYHRINFKKVYKTTTQDESYRAAFLSFEAVGRLINSIIDSLYTSSEVDEYLMIRYLAAKKILSGAVKSVNIPAISKATAEDAAIQFKALSDTLTFMKSGYNEAGVWSHTPKPYQYLFVTPMVAATIDVASLAVSYHMDKAEFMGHMVTLDSFDFEDGEVHRLQKLVDVHIDPFTQAEHEILKSVQAFLVDIDWFMVYDNLFTLESIRNPEGLYWNHNLHTWKLFSASPFNNAVVYSTIEPQINSVTISPSVASVTPGQSIAFTAQVPSTGIINQDVVWSVNSNNSSISSSGVLTVSLNETAGTLTVTATAVANSSITATANVTVVQSGAERADQ